VCESGDDNSSISCSLQRDVDQAVATENTERLDGWGAKTAALVTIAQCNTLVARCSRQLIGPADWVFVTLGPLLCD